jgi:hypothetical protein
MVPRFLNEKFPNCTQETIKARPFQRIRKYFLSARNDLAFLASDAAMRELVAKKSGRGEFLLFSHLR